MPNELVFPRRRMMTVCMLLVMVCIAAVGYLSAREPDDWGFALLDLPDLVIRILGIYMLAVGVWAFLRLLSELAPSAVPSY